MTRFPGEESTMFVGQCARCGIPATLGCTVCGRTFCRGCLDADERVCSDCALAARRTKNPVEVRGPPSRRVQRPPPAPGSIQ